MTQTPTRAYPGDLILPRDGESSPLPPVRILSFDGGPGTVLTLRILQKYQEHVEKEGRDFIRTVDTFVGVSSGCFASLSLALGLKNSEQRGSAVIAQTIHFMDEFLRLVKFSTRRLCRALGNASLISHDELSTWLKDHFQDTTLGALEPNRVLLAAFNATDLGMKIFTPGRDPHTPLTDAALASAAFPALFPVARYTMPGIRHPSLLIDGGFINNTATMAAVMEIINFLYKQPERILPRNPLENFRLLSLGIAHDSAGSLYGKLAGLYRKLARSSSPEGQVLSFHEYGWLWLLKQAAEVPFVLLGGAAARDSQFMSSLFLNRYYRFQPEINAWALLKDMMYNPDQAISRLNDSSDRIWNQPETDGLKTYLDNDW